MPRGFGSTGDILGVETVWTNVGFLTNKFVTPTVNRAYIQAQDIIFTRGTSSTPTFQFTDKAIQFATPNSLKGVVSFNWETFRSGIFWDTSEDTGFGSAEFSMKNYSYDVTFSEDANKKFNGTITNFICEFELPLNPIFDKEPREITRNLFPELKTPILTNLNQFYCPRIKASLQIYLNTLLNTAQASQTINWSYAGLTAKKTLNLTPTNTNPFKDGNFVITSNGTLAHVQGAETCENNLKLERSLKEISDKNLHAQQEDLCFILTDELIYSLINTNIGIFKQYQIVVNQNSGNQKYYPFNLWQFWEVTLYDLSLFELIGNELGKFRQTDPITINCNFTGSQNFKISPEGDINVDLLYQCALMIKDSNDGGKMKALKEFTFEQYLVGGFFMDGEALNARATTGQIKNIQGLVLNSEDILNDLRQRFEFPLNFEITNNAKLFGVNGIKFSYIKNRQIRTTKVGENLEICFK